MKSMIQRQITKGDTVSWSTFCLKLNMNLNLGITLPALFAMAFPTAANPLPLMNGYYTYEIRRSEGERILHSNPVLLKSSGLELSIFRTIVVDPLGSDWRCGGLGCDRKVHKKIGTLLFKGDSNNLNIIKATGSAKFLLGSNCRLINGPLGAQLGCQSSNAPWSDNFESFTLFSPGS